LKYHYKYYQQGNAIRLYGFTQNPNTLDYMIVMEYAKEGSLRKSLPNIVKNKWGYKLALLGNIISELDKIHQLKLVHRDFHDGNILNYTYISDLGLCRPVESFQSSKENEIYGILPFVAPEVLRGRPYTSSSDIYSFSMIMWEFTSGVMPSDGREFDLQLGLSICTGERPEIIENTPQCYIDLMVECWDSDPDERPKASIVRDVIRNWCNNFLSYNAEDVCNENINEKLKNDIIEFQKANSISVTYKKPITKSTFILRYSMNEFCN